MIKITNKILLVVSAIWILGNLVGQVYSVKWCIINCIIGIIGLHCGYHFRGSKK